MALIICEECGKEYSDKAAACPNCGCPTNDTMAQNNSVLNLHTKDVVEDKFSKDEVIKHLTYAKELETTIFTYQNAYDYLQMRIDALGHRLFIDKPKALEASDIFAPLKIIFPVFLVAVIILSLKGGNFFADLISVLTVILIFFNTELLSRALSALGIAVAVAFLFFILNLIIKLSGRAKAKKIYKNKLNEDARRVEKEKKSILQLKKQQNEIQAQIDKNEFLLNRLYSMDIIFSKYRNMVAVITMLEYFESGRCNCLMGAHGAYDTYSYEEKQNQIIGRLDVVISKLEDIKHTQYMLYEAIQESNAIAEGIYRQSEYMIETNNKIAENAALTAYNSDIISRNTTISAYIDVFKY